MKKKGGGGGGGGGGGRGGKESHYMVSHHETGSDSPIGLDRESGRDNLDIDYFH